MNKNNKKISDLEELPKEEYTDPLPMLTETAFADEAKSCYSAEHDAVPPLLQAQALAGATKPTPIAR